MAYDHVIAYARSSFVVVDIEAVINYLAARKLWHTKRHLETMHRAVQSCGYTIFYFIRPYIVFIVFGVYYFYPDVRSSAIPQAC